MQLASPSRWSSLFNEWEVDPAGATFTSPLIDKAEEQILLFSNWLKNGSVTFKLTPLEGWKEGALIIRYAGPNQYYYVGVGGWNSKVFVGKGVLPGPIFQHIKTIGSDASLEHGQTVFLRVEAVGSRIAVFENDVKVLQVLDEGYSGGQLGLRSWGTRVRFEEIQIAASPPECFVVMPFSSELDYVYRTIKETVERQGITCTRADERLEAKPIMEDVKTQIAEADLVMVDFTGRNSNVYYEAGLAEALGKKIIILAQAPSDLSFDVRHIRTLFYSDRMGAEAKLRKDLSSVLRETLGVVQNVRPDRGQRPESARGRKAAAKRKKTS